MPFKMLETVDQAILTLEVDQSFFKFVGSVPVVPSDEIEKWD